MTLDRVALARPVFTEEAIDAAAAVLRSGWPGPGDQVAAFEAEFGATIGARHVVALSSGTAALHTALRLLDLPPGSEVITTPITFVATNQVILGEGCVPVFADVQPRSGNIDPESVRSSIGPATRALMVVHLGGMPVDLDELHAIADEHGLPLIEDCAHACGAEYRDRPIGSGRSLQAFSFNSVKNLPLVEGGALCVPDDVVAARARRLRWHGIDCDTRSRAAVDAYDWQYSVAENGYKHTMSDLHAALGRAQLQVLRANNDRRREVARRYCDALRDVPGLDVPGTPADRRSSWCLYAVQTDDRDLVIERLKAHGIESGVHYKRNDLYPMFAATDLPNAERYWRRTLSLPMHPLLSDHDVDRVVEAVHKAVAEIAAARQRPCSSVENRAQRGVRR